MLMISYAIVCNNSNNNGNNNGNNNDNNNSCKENSNLIMDQDLYIQTTGN